MVQATFQEEKEILEAANYLPSVSIILPFEPKMSKKIELEYQLKRVIEKVERELTKNYVDEKTGLVTNRLKQLVRTLDYSTYKRSLAIFVSPLLEKVQNDLLHQLDAAKGARKLVSGIRKVWQEASQKKGRLLVVEKNYKCAARLQKDGQDILPKEAITDTPFYIKDAVDDIIEKVLKNGGDVEFVDEGLLENYQHIALIQYYQ